MVDYTTILLVLGILGGGWVFGKFLFRKDEEIEDRRRVAYKLAAKLSEVGLVRIPDILGAYAVGDYSGIGDEISKCWDIFEAGEDAVLKEFEKVFHNCLEKKLRTKEGRAFVAAELSEAVTETDSAIVKSAPGATTT